MRIVFLPSLASLLLAAGCTLTRPAPEARPEPAATAAASASAPADGWGRLLGPAPAASGTATALPQSAAPLQCVPEGGDCGPAQAQCCAGFTCAGINRSICIPRH
ncbi:MAG: hypothetical protein U1F50_01500 [Rubrivivax sp.]